MTKTIKRVIAGVSALAIIVGAAVGGWAINEYVIKDDQFTITDQIDGDNGGMIIDEGEGSGIKLMTTKIAAADFEEYGISPMAETAYTITVTPDPVDAMDTYTWTSSNSSAVSVSTTNGGKSCTATCLQPFGEQITLTCKSEQNPDVYAEVTVDYVKRLSSVTLSVNPSSIKFGTSATSHTVTATPVWGVGTITPSNFTVSGGQITQNIFTENFEGGNEIAGIRQAVQIPFSFTGITFSISTPYDAFVSYSFVVAAGSAIKPNLNYTEEKLKNDFNNDFLSGANSSSSDGTLTINYSYSYGDVVSESNSTSINVEFDVSGLVINAVNISTNIENIVY